MMDPTNGKASELERRTSLRTSVRLSTAGDDDYDLVAIPVSDGFRPTDRSSSHSPNPSSNINPLAPSIQNSLPTQRTPNRPSSIAKPPRNQDSLSLRHDGSPSPHVHAPTLSRVSSVSTDAAIVRSESPYQGPSGPSHPYQMYPQRTLSTATSSTTPVTEQAYTGPRGPTHPYGMYAQSTMPPGGPQAEIIPVGFSGAADGYQRRLGPDGEEVAGLIGPLGHTEELPPYTRYPEGSYVIKPESEPQRPQPAVLASLSTIPGAGGLGLATRDPEFASREDLDSPRSRLSARSFTSDSSHHEINTAAREVTEKDEPHRWQKRAKRRVWGIVPYWAICLLAIALVIMGIILGAVIGTFFRNKNSDSPDPDAFPQTLPWVDVTPLTSLPPDLPPLNVGDWALPPLLPSQPPSTACFNDTTQSQAWTCNLAMTAFRLTITQLLDRPPTSNYIMQLTSFDNNNSGSMWGKYSWGSQPYYIVEPMSLILVNETSEKSSIAWFGEMTYNKTVIVPEDRISTAKTRNSKRSMGPPPPLPHPVLELKSADYKRKGVIGAQEGDRPWICTWPGTILEVFIYPAQNNSVPDLMPPGISSMSSWPMPTPTISTNTASITGTGSGPPLPTFSSYGAMPKFDLLPVYPKVMKIAERRFPQNDIPTATCRQVQIVNDGEDEQAVVDETGKPVQVVIVENKGVDHPLAFEEYKRWMPESHLMARDPGAYDFNDCDCVWRLS